MRSARFGRSSTVFGVVLCLLAFSCAIPPRSSQHGTAAPPPGRAAEAAEAKVALVVFNPQLGKLTENIAALTDLVSEALRQGANMVVAPELATTGYSITAAQVRGGLGIKSPFPELNGIRDLARKARSYVVLGIAEIAAEPGEKLYNSVVTFGPEGLVSVQRKRGTSVWNERGNLPFTVIPTPYGRLGTIICSDAYLMDWARVSRLAGADIILSPANWWGMDGQEKIWQTRAQENGIWFLVANRWGMEVDNRFNPPYTYQMNDGPSVSAAPSGKLELIYRANQDNPPANKILYAKVEVGRPRGERGAATYTVAYRRPSAYTAIANRYYRPDEGSMPVPGLPPAGNTRAAVLAYSPSPDASQNLATITRLLASSGTGAEVLVLPGLGLSPAPIDAGSPRWYEAAPWRDFQKIVDTAKIQLAVTTVLRREHGGARPLVLLARAGQPPRLEEQIHETWAAPGSGRPPLTLDLPHARVGVISGVDLLFPEIATQLAKSGVDLVVVSSTVGRESPHSPGPVGWTMEDLFRTWKADTDQCFHVAGADSSGNGSLVQDGGCFALKEQRLSPGQSAALDLDSTTERKKFLNAYYPFDLKSLLEGFH